MKDLDSYKNDQYWIIQHDYENFVTQDGFTIQLSTGKNIPLLLSNYEQYNFVRDTYEIGDYILDRNKVKWYLTQAEIEELTNTVTIEIKKTWEYKNSQQDAVLACTTPEEVEAINFEYITVSTFGVFPTYKYYTKSESDIHFATISDFSDHTDDKDNPHRVTPEQVGNDVAQWNAKKLRGTKISSKMPTTGQYLMFNGVSWIPTTDTEPVRKQVAYQPNGQGGNVSWDKNIIYEYVITVTGARVGDSVVVNPDAAIYGLIKVSSRIVMMIGYVFDPDTVKVLVKVESGGTAIPLGITDTIRITCI